MSVLDFRTFDPRFKSGLMFSIFEGLLFGESIKMIVAEDPNELKRQFQEAHLKNFEWSAKKIDPNVWEVEILKKNI